MYGTDEELFSFKRWYRLNWIILEQKRNNIPATSISKNYRYIYNEDIIIVRLEY